MTTIIFTVDNLRFARKSFDILTLADCLTVLQTYRQAFSFPQLSLNSQLTCIYGIFLSQVVKSSQLESEKSRI